jgi:hypothetical protein
MTASMTCAELTRLPAALTVPQRSWASAAPHAYRAVKSGDWPTPVIRWVGASGSPPPRSCACSGPAMSPATASRARAQRVAAGWASWLSGT